MNRVVRYLSPSIATQRHLLTVILTVKLKRFRQEVVFFQTLIRAGNN